MNTFGVAAKAVVKNKDGKYLVLMKSSKDDINPNTYDIPGGRMSFGEKPEETVVREVKEETGLDIKPLKILEVWTFTKENFQLVGINFLCEVIGGGLKLGEEHDGANWYTYEELTSGDSFPEWLVNTIKKTGDSN